MEICQRIVKSLSSPCFWRLVRKPRWSGGTDPLSQLLERGPKFGGVSPGNNQDARKSRRIKAESRKKPSPTDNGIAPKEAAIQASCSTRAMSVKVII